MMDGGLLLQSALIGFAVAAPVGPMGLLCIQRTIAHGRWAGLAVGAGIAAADCSYAIVAAFGITSVSNGLLAAAPLLQLAGSMLLVVLGLKIALMRVAVHRTAGYSGEDGGHVRAFLTGYGMTLTSLPTIFFFAGIFASFGALGSALESALFSAGVLFDSLAWWLVLTTLVCRSAARITPRLMLWLNRGSGAALAGFGAFALAAQVLG